MDRVGLLPPDDPERDCARQTHWLCCIYGSKPASAEAVEAHIPTPRCGAPREGSLSSIRCASRIAHAKGTVRRVNHEERSCAARPDGEVVGLAWSVRGWYCADVQHAIVTPPPVCQESRPHGCVISGLPW